MSRVLVIGGFGHLDNPLTEFDKAGADVTMVVEPKHLAKSRQVSGRPAIVVEDVASAEQVLAGLYRHGLSLENFDTVCALNEYSIVAASILAAAGGVSGLDPATAVALRDKAVQKERVHAAGIPVASCLELNFESDLDIRPLEFPIIIKPLAGAGARDTHLVRSIDGLIGLRDKGELRSAGPWLLENYIEGDELHVDGVVRDGRIVFQSVSRYLETVIEMRRTGTIGSVTLDSRQYAELYERVRDMLTVALAALVHHDGVFHAEVFDNAGALTFSECAGRIGGGMIRELLSYRYDVDLVAAWAAATLGRHYDISPTLDGPVCGWMRLPATAGRVVRVPDVARLLERPGCLQARLSATESAVMAGPGPISSQAAGVILVAGATEVEVATRMRDIVEWFGSELVTVDLSLAPSSLRAQK